MTDRVFGMFSRRDDVVDAIRELKDAGFDESHVGVAMQDHDVQREIVEESGSDAARGATAGAVSGGVVGGLIGLLGSLLIPGLGPIVVGGVLASTLTGAGIGAASGGLVGALVGAGASDAEAEHFDAAFRAGGILLTVDAGDRREEVVAILLSHGADLGPAPRGATDDSAIVAAARATPDSDRRAWDDPGYAGPERRLVSV
jgi:hypothetical protein